MNRILHYSLLLLWMFFIDLVVSRHAIAQQAPAAKTSIWVSALDQSRVQRNGSWQESRFRYAAESSLATRTAGTSLECRFEGTGVVLRLGAHAVPAYGAANTGSLIVTVDGQHQKTIVPLATPREIVVARGLADGEHVLRVVHRAANSGAGCRIEGFFVLRQPTADLQFAVSGEDNAFLVDARATLRRGDSEVRSVFVRNWLTGQCSLAGLPPGEDYTLDIAAVGWGPVRIDGIRLITGKTTSLKPVFLRRDKATRISAFRFPALNRPAIRLGGQTFRARFLGYKSTIDEVRLIRTVGPATISRRLKFEEDKVAAYYYDREVVAALPDDIPPGLYNLQVKLSGSRNRPRFCFSPRSVHVVRKFPTDPVLVTFGHLDTSGQYQAEYLERLAAMTNLMAPDIVLNSTAVNPAYISGALAQLDMPHIVNFGNHQFYGHEKWYGDPVGLVDFGPDLCILNFGHPWHTDRSKAEALLEARAGVKHKIINAFESNSPIAFLNRQKINMIHDAHGIGKKVDDLGSTPTRRVGKVNAVSFRVVRFRAGRVATCTYDGDEIAPSPFRREESPPLRVDYSSPNDGTNPNITATITNDYLEAFPNGRLTFVLPRGMYKVVGGRIETSITSDDKKYTVLSLRTDIPRQGKAVVRVQRQSRNTSE